MVRRQTGCEENPAVAPASAGAAAETQHTRLCGFWNTRRLPQKTSQGSPWSLGSRSS